MRKLKLLLISLSMFLIAALTSCGKPGEVRDYNIMIRRNSIDYKVKRIILNTDNESIYILYPVSDTIKSIPATSTAVIPGGDDNPDEIIPVVELR